MKRPKFDNCLKLKSGKMIVKTTDPDTVRVLRELTTSDDLLREAKPLFPKILIKNVSSLYSKEFIMEEVKEQTGIEGSITLVYKTGPRRTNSVDWVADMSPNLFGKLANLYLFISERRCWVAEYISVRQCLKCLKLGHKAIDCASESVYWHCAKQGHKSKDCASKNISPTCVNCDGKHKSSSGLCPAIIRIKKSIKKNTNYRTPSEVE